MTSPTDTAEEAARKWLHKLYTEDFKVDDVDDLAALLRERERAGIERAATFADEVCGEPNSHFGNRIRALLPKEGT